jgi:hypothetical protein
MLFLSIFACGILFTQNIFANGGSEGFSGSAYNMEEFKSRFTEIKNDADFNNNVAAGFTKGFYHGNYAGSQNSLQEFKSRFTEIKNDADFNNNVAAGFTKGFYY